jgi:hypothetical protein
MLFTGSELIQKRNFFTQTGNYGFVMSATVDTTTGAYHFGLSGNAQQLDFVLQSGHIYWNNNVIHSYKAFEQFTIEAQFSTGHANVLKNNSPLVYGSSKPTGYFDYFYFSRENANMGAEFDVNVSGDNAAVYSITQQGYLYSTGQNAVTGWMINQSQFPLRVFDSVEQSSAIYDFGKLVGNIGAGGSGAFAYTGDYNNSNFDFSEPILTTFATNYGDASVLFSIIDARSFDSFVQLTSPNDFSFNTDYVFNQDLSYINFSGGVATDQFNTNLTFLLGYVSGSGSYANFTDYSVSAYGDFNLSGLVTGWLDNATGAGPITGSAFATGAATGFFSGMGTGMVSGIGYTGLGTGYMTGLSTGFIRAGSGTLGLIYPHVGSGISAIATSLTGAVYATGYVDLSNMNDGEYFVLIRPNGTDYEASPLARLYCNYLPSDPADCLFDDPQNANADFPTATDLIECISGFSDLGINGVYDGGDIIYWTATAIGSVGNGIIASGDDGGFDIPGTDIPFTGGHDGLAYVGTVRPMGQPYTGAFPITITGSGSYVTSLTGQHYLSYYKTFTGSWSIATGVDANSLVSLNSESSSLYSGSGVFPPNSSVNLQITYTPSGDTPDGAYLIVTGANLLSGINQQLSQP